MPNSTAWWTRSRHAKEWIANLEAVERQRLDIKSLKVGYNKVFGYYIEVTNTHATKVPAEYIRKQTIANGERYITPELKEYETLVLNADERRLEIEQNLFGEVCSQISSHAAQLLALAHSLAELDVYAALAEVALLRRYVRPLVDEGPPSRSAAGATRWLNWPCATSRLCPTTRSWPPNAPSSSSPAPT
jgi:DNA mismatch repair protein MutS